MSTSFDSNRDILKNVLTLFDDEIFFVCFTKCIKFHNGILAGKKFKSQFFLCQKAQLYDECKKFITFHMNLIKSFWIEFNKYLFWCFFPVETDNW